MYEAPPPYRSVQRLVYSQQQKAARVEPPVRLPNSLAEICEWRHDNEPLLVRSQMRFGTFCCLLTHRKAGFSCNGRQRICYSQRFQEAHSQVTSCSQLFPICRGRSHPKTQVPGPARAGTQSQRRPLRRSV
ncbi:hypothetical protein BC567DRAFT_235181 [Phyllosticta citribraziliensis]